MFFHVCLFNLKPPTKGTVEVANLEGESLGESSVKRTFSTGVERGTVNVRRNEAPTKKVSANHHLKPPLSGLFEIKEFTYNYSKHRFEGHS